MKTRIMTFALLATVVCGGCGDVSNEASALSVIHDAAMVKAGIVDTVAQYRAAARQGDGHAYLALAYFMQPVLEEHLSVSTAAYFRRCLNEDRVRYTDNYDGHLMDFAKHMLPFIVEGIEHPLEPDYWRILDHGGWMKLFSSPVIGSGSINCYAVYTVCERVMLRLTREYGKRQSMVTVEMFNGERELLAWANDVPVAAYTLESDMIDLFCDRFRNVTMMMG